MRSPLRAWRDFREEFTRVMEEHERFLRSEFAPEPDRLARARGRRTAPTDRPLPGDAPAEGATHANQ